ncbi:hypothetical protein C4J81_02195 [Deltaproteobacteria bacterium Smac51]|nr:hypothetical protein C4J81_02195 [Deltaproteobacteria bacterium Smac51]
MKRLLLVVAAVILLGGCGGIKATEAGYQARMESLKGVNIDEVVMAWGPPDGEFTFEDGRRMYSFVKTRVVTVQRMAPAFVARRRFGPRYDDGDWPYMVNEMRRYYCETRLITDSQRRIMEWDFNGNACRAVPPEAEKDQKEPVERL